MFKFRFAAPVFAAFICIPSASYAGANEDAQFIVEKTVTPEMFAGVAVAMRPVLTSAISNDLRDLGITLNDPDRFFDVFIEEFMDEFLTLTKDEMIALQLAVFTPEELEGIAAFYATPAGVALLAKTPRLIQDGASIGQRVGAIAGANAGPRVAARLRNEDVLTVESPNVLERLIEMLE